MNPVAILTHTVGTEENQDIISFCVEKAAAKMPVFLYGHGILDSSIEEKCLHVDWNDKIDSSQIGKGHPILVEKALTEAQRRGFDRVWKMRADTACFLGNPERILEDVLWEEGTKCVVTAQTNLTNRIGDLFMYGHTDFLLSLWKPEEWNYSLSGMENLKNIFNKEYGNSLETLLEYMSYRDCLSLMWALIPKNFNNDWRAHLWDKTFPAEIDERDYYSSQSEFEWPIKGGEFAFPD